MYSTVSPVLYCIIPKSGRSNENYVTGMHNTSAIKIYTVTPTNPVIEIESTEGGERTPLVQKRDLKMKFQKIAGQHSDTF